MTTPTQEILYEDSHLTIREPLVRTLDRAEKPEECWLMCLHCNRFFQVKHLQVDFLGNRQQCPFLDCGAAGFDVDIHLWDTWRQKGRPGWPTEDQLVFGMEAPY